MIPRVPVIALSAGCIGWAAWAAGKETGEFNGRPEILDPKNYA